jgi:protoporphyrinogen oxidase
VPVVIIGAGPAGLTAAYELSANDIASVVVERTDIVGWIAQTAEYKGYLFDIGGHRFFTKVTLVERLWHEVRATIFCRGRGYLEFITTRTLSLSAVPLTH